MNPVKSAPRPNEVYQQIEENRQKIFKDVLDTKMKSIENFSENRYELFIEAVNVFIDNKTKYDDFNTISIKTGYDNNYEKVPAVICKNIHNIIKNKIIDIAMSIVEANPGYIYVDGPYSYNTICFIIKEDKDKYKEKMKNSKNWW